MNGVLVVALALPLAGAVVAALVPSRRSLAPLAAGLAAAAWAIVTAAGDAPELGRIVATPVVAAMVAGTALLVAARPPVSSLSRSAHLCGITVVAVGASTGGDVPDRPLAAGLAVLVLVVVVEHRSGALHPWWAMAPAVAGAVMVVGLLGGWASVVVAAAAAVALGSLVGRTASGRILVPAAVLAAARAAQDAHLTDDGSTTVALAAALSALVVAATVVLVVRRRPLSAPGEGPGPTADVVPLAGVAAAFAMVGQDVAELRSAGLLLAAGAVVALAARHPYALVAVLPGLAAAVEGFSRATEPEHAVAGAAVVGLAASVLRRPRSSPAEPVAVATVSWPGSWPVAVALGFAVLPAWGWSGADPDGYVEAVVTAVAVAVVVALGSLATDPALRPVVDRARRRRSGPVPAGSARRIGRIRRRSNAVHHGSTDPLEEDGSPEGSVQDPVQHREDAAGGGAGEAPQHPVAVPPRIVPRRAGAGGVGGRGRLRARPGRPPG